MRTEEEGEREGGRERRLLSTYVSNPTRFEVGTLKSALPDYYDAEGTRLESRLIIVLFSTVEFMF